MRKLNLKKSVLRIFTCVFLFAAAFSTAAFAADSSDASVSLEAKEKQIEVILHVPEEYVMADVQTLSVKFSVGGTAVDSADFEFASFDQNVVVKEYRFSNGVLTVYVSGRTDLFTKGELALGKIVVKDSEGKEIGAEVQALENGFKVVNGESVTCNLNNAASDKVNTGSQPTDPENPDNPDPEQPDSEEPSLEYKQAVQRFYEECLAYYKQENHSEENWERYQAAMNRVNMLISDPDATKADLENAVKELLEITTIMNKELPDGEGKPVPPNSGEDSHEETKPVQDNKKENAAVTGDQAKIAVVGIVLLSAAIIIVVVVMKKAKRK